MRFNSIYCSIFALLIGGISTQAWSAVANDHPTLSERMKVCDSIKTNSNESIPANAGGLVCGHVVMTSWFFEKWYQGKSWMPYILDSLLADSFTIKIEFPDGKIAELDKFDTLTHYRNEFGQRKYTNKVEDSDFVVNQWEPLTKDSGILTLRYSEHYDNLPPQPSMVIAAEGKFLVNQTNHTVKTLYIHEVAR